MMLQVTANVACIDKNTEKGEKMSVPFFRFTNVIG